MRRPSTSRRRVDRGGTARAAGILLPTVLVLGGCDPIFDIGGAFFPSWVFAVVVGLVGLVIVREILVRLKIDEHLYGHGLAYLGVFVTISIIIWIWFFRT